MIYNIKITFSILLIIILFIINVNINNKISYEGVLLDMNLNTKEVCASGECFMKYRDICGMQMDWAVDLCSESSLLPCNN